MTKLKYIVIGFVNLISLFACEKQPFDYRNKFVGDYEFYEKRIKYTNIPPNFGIMDTSYAISMKTKVVRGENSNEITFIFDIFILPRPDLKEIVNVTIYPNSSISGEDVGYGIPMGFIKEDLVELIFFFRGDTNANVKITYIGKKIN